MNVQLSSQCVVLQLKSWQTTAAKNARNTSHKNKSSRASLIALTAVTNCVPWAHGSGGYLAITIVAHRISIRPAGPRLITFVRWKQTRENVIARGNLVVCGAGRTTPPQSSSVKCTPATSDLCLEESHAAKLERRDRARKDTLAETIQ